MNSRFKKLFVLPTLLFVLCMSVLALPTTAKAEDTVTVTYAVERTTITYTEQVPKGSEYTLKTHIDGFVKSGWEFYRWYSSIAGACAPGSTITVDQDIRFVATWNELTEHKREDATCTTAGTEAYWYSNNSKKYYSDEFAQNQIDGPVAIPATGHKLEAHARVEPTETEEGTEAYWECSVCGAFFSDAEGKNEISNPIVIPPTGKKDDGKTDDEKTRDSKSSDSSKSSKALPQTGDATNFAAISAAALAGVSFVCGSLVSKKN